MLSRTFARGLSLVAALSALVAVTWPGLAQEMPDRLALRELLRQEDFQTLDRRLAALQRAFEADGAAEDRVEIGFLSFNSWDPALTPHHDAWARRMPGSFAAHTARGIHYWRRGWHLRGRAPEQETPPERIAAQRASFRIATAALERALAINERLSIAHGFLINVAIALGEDETRKRRYDRALRATPASFFVRDQYSLGLIPSRGGTFGRMVAFVFGANWHALDNSRLLAFNGYPLYLLAEGLASTRGRERARKYFDMALWFGEHWRYLEARALNFLYLGAYDEASRDYDRLLAIRPQHPGALHGRAVARFERGEEGEARADIALARRLAPRDASTFVARAAARRAAGRYGPALELYDLALLYGARDAAIWRAKGEINAFDLDRAEAAAAAFARAFALAPDDPATWRAHARLLAGRRDCEALSALRTYRRLCEEGGACSRADLDWAIGAQNALVRTSGCAE